MSESREMVQLRRRLTQMEEWAMHSEKMLETLHESLCEAHRELEAQRRKNEQLSLLMHRLQARLEEGEMPADERPPHY